MNANALKYNQKQFLPFPFPVCESRKQPGNESLSKEDLPSGAEVIKGVRTSTISTPLMADPNERDLYWQKIPLWSDVSEQQFQEKKWQVS
jgi:hypothetical protein